MSRIYESFLTILSIERGEPQPTVSYEGIRKGGFMTSQKKNQFICEQSGGCWHELHNYADEDGIACSKCGKAFSIIEAYMANPDFESEAGRVQLLKLIREHKDFGDFLAFYKTGAPIGLYLPSIIVSYIRTDFITDDTGKFRDAV